jgi:protein gp37
VSETTKISWATSTFNPWIGCTKVSPGCEHCYAESLDKRWGHARWGVGMQRSRTSPAYWRQPLKWNEKARESGKPWRVFCASLADVFDNEVPEDWRVDLFDLIEATPYLTWMVLTKRIGNASAYRFPKNLWLGATVVNQEEASRDVPRLLEIPATKHWISYEPALGPVDWCEALGIWWNQTEKRWIQERGPRVDWIIVGGESGGQARPFVLGWAKDTARQCKIAGVAVHVKQLGSNPTNREGEPHHQRDRAGRDPSEWPEILRVQEWPT